MNPLGHAGLFVTRPSKAAIARGNPIPLAIKPLSRERAIGEPVGEPIRNIRRVGHTRHRSAVNAMADALTASVAHTRQPRIAAFVSKLA